jgi:succinate dehydrogenase / fumarate reductase membrane anchor subunit
MATQLGKVRGLGSAKTGTTAYLIKQFTGFLLAVLTPFMIWIVISMVGKSYAETRAALQSLWVAPVVFAFLALTFEHMRLGMNEIIIDYVHGSRLKTALVILNAVFAWGVGLACLFALIRLFVSAPLV